MVEKEILLKKNLQIFLRKKFISEIPNTSKKKDYWGFLLKIIKKIGIIIG